MRFPFQVFWLRKFFVTFVFFLSFVSLCIFLRSKTPIFLRVFLFFPSVVQVKCTLVQALRLCTGRTSHRGSRGIALPCRDHGTRRGWGISVTPRPLYSPGKDTVPIIQEVGWVPGPVWKGVENLGHTGIRSLDSPARSQSLYRLSYRAHLLRCTLHILSFSIPLSFVYFVPSLCPSCNIACYFYPSLPYIIFHFSLSEILSSQFSLNVFWYLLYFYLLHCLLCFLFALLSLRFYIQSVLLLCLFH